MAMYTGSSTIALQPVSSHTVTSAATTTMLMIAIGVIHFHANASSWSMRNRGSVPRVHTKRKYTVYILPM